MPYSLLTANVTNCSSTVTYVWRRNGQTIPGATTNTLNPNLGAGLYEVLVTCGNQVPACTDVSSFETLCDPMDVLINASSGQLTSIPAASCSNYSVSWVYNSQVVGTNMSLVPNQGNGVYTANYTCNDNNSQRFCTDTTSYTCNVNVSLTSSNNSISSTVSGCTGYNYQWYTGTLTVAQLSPSLAISGATSSSYTPSVSGQYTLAVTCTNSGCVNVASINFVRDCNAFNVSYTTSGGRFNAVQTTCPSASYAWTYNNQLVGSNSSYIPVNGNGNYTVVVNCNSGEFNNCTSTNTFNCNTSVVITPAGQTLTAQGSGCGSYTYQWAGPAGFTSTASSINVTTSGIYTVTSICVESGCRATASYNYQGCNGIVVTLNLEEKNTVGFNATGCGSVATHVWTVTTPNGTQTFTTPTVSITPVDGDITVTLQYTCGDCPPITLTHTVIRRTVSYTIKGIDANTTLKSLEINGNSYITSPVTTNTASASAAFTSLIQSLKNNAVLKSALDITATEIEGFVGTAITAPYTCATGGSQLGIVIRFSKALIQNHNTSNTFGPMEFDFAASTVNEGGTGFYTYPSYYINTGATVQIANRTSTSAGRNFTTTVDMTETASGQNYTLKIIGNGWSINTLANACHLLSYPTGGFDLVNSLPSFTFAINTWLSSRGGGTATATSQGNGVFVININNAIAPPIILSRASIRATDNTILFQTRYYNFLEI